MNKTWFITGASSGIGKVMTQRLLARGDRVAATIRQDGALADLAQKHGSNLAVFKLDVTDTENMRGIIADAFDRLGRIDVVVSNAGYGLFGAAEELTDTQIDRQLATNLTGSIQLIRAALPHLRKQSGGRIVQVSSEGGLVAYPGFGLYHATKWGIEGFIETVAQEVASFGIGFIIAEPGPTVTNFGASLARPAPMDIYDDTPAGTVRRAIDSGNFALKGDVVRTVDAIISTADKKTPPFRLPLGSTAYDNIVRELSKRLAEIKDQRPIAYSADRQEE